MGKTTEKQKLVQDFSHQQVSLVQGGPRPVINGDYGAFVIEIGFLLTHTMFSLCHLLYSCEALNMYCIGIPPAERHHEVFLQAAGKHHARKKWQHASRCAITTRLVKHTEYISTRRTPGSGCLKMLRLVRSRASQRLSLKTKCTKKSVVTQHSEPRFAFQGIDSFRMHSLDTILLHPYK